MAKDKTLEELIAALDGDSAPPTMPSVPPTFNPASAAVPIAVPAPAMNPAPVRPQHAASSAATRPYGTTSGNFDELVKYLGGNGTGMPGSLPTPQAPAAAQPAGFNSHTAPTMMPAQRRQMAPHRVTNPNHRSSDANLSAAEFRRQQVQASKASHKREAVLASAQSRAATAPSPSPSTPAATQAPGDITAELNAVMRKNGVTSVASAVSASARPGQRAIAVGGRPPQRPQGAPAAVPANRSRGQITQEQIIVGHFCRHAIKTLARVMENNPLKQQTEIRLKEHIKSVWAQWVRGAIQRQKLLESVASFVRNSCPQAMSIDVIREFKTWYEREFELQKQRSTADRRALQQHKLAQQQKHAQQQRSQAQAILGQRNGQQVPALHAQAAQVPGVKVQYPARAPNAGRGLAVTNKVGSEPQLVNQQFVKGEPQVAQLGNRTGAKSISNKTVARKVPTARPSKGTAGKPYAGKSVANKSVGGKSISRPPPASLVKTQIGVKGPSMQTGPKPALASVTGSAGMVAGKVVTGSKGLLASKLPAGAKPKGPRKAPSKGAAKSSPSKGTVKPPPAKAPGKVSPKGPSAKLKQPPSVATSGVSSPVALTPPLQVTGKRPLDSSVGSPAGNALKKTKTAPKAPKSGPNRKKSVSFPQAGAPGKNTKPPPAKADMMKGRQPAGSLGAHAGVAGISTKGGTGSTAGANSATGSHVKKVERVNNHLSVVQDVIDIEIEEDMLGRDAGGGPREVIEIFDYNADMLLAGPTLRAKMQATARRYALDENISKDAVELVSLAVHERLKNFLESLKGIAAVRVETSKNSWSTETFGVSLHEKLERMREDEERSLTVAVELRVKRKKEQLEKEAKKLAGDAEKEEKKNRDSSAAAEQERKEKIALEKKRKEHSSQRDALSGLLAGIDKKRKKPNASKTLAPLPPITKSGGSRSSASVLPPIPGMVGSGDVSGKGSINSSKSGKKLDPLEKLKALGPVVKLGGPRASSMPGAARKSGDGPRLHPTLPVTLRDCLFLMESEQNTRKSSHIYKWYARLEAKQQAVKGK